MARLLGQLKEANLRLGHFNAYSYYVIKINSELLGSQLKEKTTKITCLVVVCYYNSLIFFEFISQNQKYK